MSTTQTNTHTLNAHHNRDDLSSQTHYFHSTKDINFSLVFLFVCNFRYANQSVTNHGKISIRFVWTVQFGDSPRRFGRCHQQETVARNHQRFAPSIEHHKCSIYTTNTVSKMNYICIGLLRLKNASKWKKIKATLNWIISIIFLLCMRFRADFLLHVEKKLSSRPNKFLFLCSRMSYALKIIDFMRSVTHCCRHNTVIRISSQQAKYALQLFYVPHSLAVPSFDSLWR